MNMIALKNAVNAFRPEAILFGAKQKEWAEALNQNDSTITSLAEDNAALLSSLEALCTKFFPDATIGDWDTAAGFVQEVIDEAGKAEVLISEMKTKLTDEEKKYGELEAKHQDLLEKLEGLSTPSDETPDEPAANEG